MSRLIVFRAGARERRNIFFLSPFLRDEGRGEGSIDRLGLAESPPHPDCCAIRPLPASRERLRMKTYAAFGSAALVSANAQSIHCVSSATSFASTVAPHQMRKPAGASR